jgi:hypothetical protein
MPERGSGKPVVHTNLSLEPDLYKWVASRRETDGQTISWVVNRALRQYMEQAEKQANTEAAWEELAANDVARRRASGEL